MQQSQQSTYTHQYTNTHTQPFYGSVEFVRDNPGEPVPKETFTHYTHRGHQSSLYTSQYTNDRDILHAGVRTQDVHIH